ncbi:MAG: hypothetical protein ACLPV4_09405, partial [Solirubrobacteraceae bacterium]
MAAGFISLFGLAGTAQAQPESGVPSISGTLQEGQTLSVTDTTAWTDSDSTISGITEQWYDCNSTASSCTASGGVVAQSA